MKKFKQMSKSDRIKMEALLNAGLSKAAVAEQLHFTEAQYIENMTKVSICTETLTIQRKSVIAVI